LTSLPPVITSCVDAPLDRMAEQIGQWKLGVLHAPRIAQMLSNKITEARPRSSSRTGMNPPSEAILDPWKSTFNEELKES
jgi:hypothetical protein